MAQAAVSRGNSSVQTGRRRVQQVEVLLMTLRDRKIQDAKLIRDRLESGSEAEKRSTINGLKFKKSNDFSWRKRELQLPLPIDFFSDLKDQKSRKVDMGFFHGSIELKGWLLHRLV